MAYEYPSAIFIGVDISPIFPSEKKKPENATFLQNMLDGLPFEDNTFDFVYQRSLASAISEDQWKCDVIHELYRVTKPGGWIELMYVSNKDSLSKFIFLKIFSRFFSCREAEILSPKESEAPNCHRFNRARKLYKMLIYKISNLVNFFLKKYSNWF